MVVLNRAGVTGAALWAALAAALGYSAAVPLLFHPPALSAEKARTLGAELDQALADGHLPEALFLVRRLLRSFPEDAVFLRREAQIFDRLGDHKSESAAYEQAMALSPTPTENCPALGRSYRKQGLAEKALDADRRCLEAETTNVDMRLYYALALEHADRVVESRRMYESVLALEPSYMDAAVGLARLDMASGDLPRAIKTLEALNRVKPNPDALSAQARAEERSGRRERAKALLRQALKIAPDYEDLRNQLKALEGAP